MYLVPASRDPVCVMNVLHAGAHRAVPYIGEMLYFAANIAKRLFQDDPARYGEYT